MPMRQGCMNLRGPLTARISVLVMGRFDHYPICPDDPQTVLFGIWLVF